MGLPIPGQPERPGPLRWKEDLLPLHQLHHSLHHSFHRSGQTHLGRHFSQENRGIRPEKGQRCEVPGPILHCSEAGWQEFLEVGHGAFDPRLGHFQDESVQRVPENPEVGDHLSLGGQQGRVDHRPRDHSSPFLAERRGKAVGEKPVQHVPRGFPGNPQKPSLPANSHSHPPEGGIVIRPRRDEVRHGLGACPEPFLSSSIMPRIRWESAASGATFR